MSGPNLRLEPPSNGSFVKLSRSSSKGIPWDVFLIEVIVVNVLVSGVSEGFINFPVSGGFQGFSSSFNPIAFIPGIVSEISKVFQGDVSLSDILLTIDSFTGSGVLCVNQLLAFVNFRIPISSSRFSSFGIMVYNEINSANSPEVGALSNPLVC